MVKCVYDNAHGAKMTVKEIAELAGVSIGTVDRVLHGRGRVSVKTKEKIEHIIQESGFKPNPIARRLKRNKAYRFTALIPERSEDSGYWGQIRSGILDAASEISPFGIEVHIQEFDRYNRDSFRSCAEQTLLNEPDAVLLAPIMPEECRHFINQIQGKLPYVFFDADLPDTQPLCVIAQDSLRGGQLAGRLAHLFSGTIQGCFSIFVAYQGDFHIMQRRNGFIHYAEKASFKTAVTEGLDLENDDSVREALDLLLAEHPDVQGVFVTSASAHRVADAARNIRKKQEFIIIGFDMVEKNHRLLAQGDIDAIISQRPKTQGRKALLTLYQHLVVGNQVEARIDIPLDVYIRENVPCI